MATCSTSVQAVVACPVPHLVGDGEKHAVRQARFVGVFRPRGVAAVSVRSLRGGAVCVRAQAGESGSSVQQSDKSWGEGVSLGTALLPPDCDLGRLESLLFQWGNSLTANANLPLPTSLKVDKVKGGVRLGYIRIKDGAIEDLVHIDAIVNAAEGDQKAYFQATRNGQYKDKVPPGEPLIMQSLLQALRKSIQIARE